MAVVNCAAVNTGEQMSTGAFALALGYIQQRWSCWVTWSHWSCLQQMRVLILPRSADTNFLLSLVATLATGPESLKLGELCWTPGWAHMHISPCHLQGPRVQSLEPPTSFSALSQPLPAQTPVSPDHTPLPSSPAPALRCNGTSVRPTQGCRSHVPAAHALPALPGPGVMAPLPLHSSKVPFSSWPVHGTSLVSAGILEPPHVEQAP